MEGTTMKIRRLTPLVAALVATAMPAISMADPFDHDWHAHHEWNHPGYRHDDYRGVGPDHGWHRGDRLPNEYWGRRHEVADWRARNLAPPPRGYHWVEVNGDYVLAAIATGIILDTLLTQQ
jgi:Ni/Co efflux regulator RcnB